MPILDGRQNFLYQKAVLEGLCKLYFNKKIVCPNPSWAHAFVSGLCFCRTCLSYKNQVSFCRELFFGHAKPWAQEPSFCRRHVGQAKRGQMVSILLGRSCCNAVNCFACFCMFRPKINEK